MIKINEKKYDEYIVKVTFGNVDAFVMGEKVKGLSPFISFNIEDNIFLGIETVISKEMLEKININERINMNSYLTDFTYEDEKGWISMIDGNYNFEIVRLSINSFQIKFNIDYLDQENINICIDSIVELL